MASKATLKKMEKMFNGDLPIVNAKVTTGTRKIPTPDKPHQDFDIEYVQEIIPVEVLTVNFNTGNMRVRYIANLWGAKKIESIDISNELYLDKYMNGAFKG